MSAKGHVHSAEEKHALKVRVRKIAGQLKAIETMLDDDRDCPEILTQVVSARKALKSFAEKLIHEISIIALMGRSRSKAKRNYVNYWMFLSDTSNSKKRR